MGELWSSSRSPFIIIAVAGATVFMIDRSCLVAESLGQTLIPSPMVTMLPHCAAVIIVCDHLRSICRSRPNWSFSAEEVLACCADTPKGVYNSAHATLFRKREAARCGPLSTKPGAKGFTGLGPAAPLIVRIDHWRCQLLFPQIDRPYSAAAKTAKSGLNAVL